MSNISKEADDLGEDNVDLMSIGGAIAAVNAHPVPIRLSTTQVAQVIDDLPHENKAIPAGDQPNSTPANKATETPMLPTKGELKVKNYRLQFQKEL